jgi:RecB family endonuclease NucS
VEGTNPFMPVSKELEDQIKALLLEQQLSCREIANKLGVGVQVVAGYQAAMTKRSGSQSTELAEALETTFGLERDLQKALRNNIEQLERGLKIIDGGKERKVESGFIDITAKDKSGTTVVIELKAGSADREAIGQIAGYIGDLQATDQSVRGIIVASEFPPAVVSALGALPNLQLRRYRFNFSFEAVNREKK